MIRTLTFAALAIAVTIIPVAAMAQPEITIRGAEQSYRTSDSFRTYVHYRDLNLTTAEGGAALKSRVKAAARDGCDGLYAPQPMMQTWDERSMCFRSSVAEAMPQVDRLVQLAQRGGAAGTQIAVAFRR